VKRISGRDLAEALGGVIDALSWERLDISATPYRGDVLFRSASQRMFLLQCVMGKGPLPFPVLRDLRVVPPGPGQAGAPPLAVLVTSHALDDRIWAAFASAGILVIHCPPGEPPGATGLRVLAILQSLEKAATGAAGTEDIDGVVGCLTPQRTAGVIADAASAFRQLGGYRHAVRLYSMSLGDLFHRLGGDDPAVLELRSQFADVLFWDGRRDDAERELQVVHQRRCLILGQGHPDTLVTFSKLQALDRSRSQA
jgi:hypothetical protein